MLNLPLPSTPPAAGGAQPCYSARLLQPFLTVLARSPRVPSGVKEQLAKLDAEQRVYVAYVHSLLACAETVIDEPLLGLRASEVMTTGDAGMFDFLMTSADTPRMAITAGNRFMRLISDSHDLSLSIVGERAVARFESRVAIPRAGEDFAIASLLRNHIFGWPEGMLEDMDVWFRHDAPSDVTPYRQVLGPVRLHFAADRVGFGFPARYLDAPLRKRDARLHSVLQRAAEEALASLPSSESLTERVGQLVSTLLGMGDVTLPEIARQLKLHPRKLSRGLVREGTTFQELVEGVRRSTAMQHLAHGDLTISQIAKLSGFTGKAPFHRAFRRWTRDTPAGYRRKHRGDRAGMRLAPPR
ncbi:MAG TPA: AraC family transcriptional regulator ligand-binding domain-containing protein [Polyangiales bacterium]|nr:AraC family transcriptional regulator ligand-binding domain-containing protein [Polyangiales bacterium]